VSYIITRIIGEAHRDVVAFPILIVITKREDKKDKKEEDKKETTTKTKTLPG
jgi:hypothetical protein